MKWFEFLSPNQYTRKKFQNLVKSFFSKRYTEIWRIKRKNLGRVYLGLPFFLNRGKRNLF